jgi:hypothetical protein
VSVEVEVVVVAVLTIDVWVTGGNFDTQKLDTGLMTE